MKATYNTPMTAAETISAQSLLTSSPTTMTVGGGTNNPLNGTVNGGNPNNAMAPGR